MAFHLSRLRRALPLLHRSLRRPNPISFSLLSTDRPTPTLTLFPVQLTKRFFTSTSALSFGPEMDEMGPEALLAQGFDYKHWLITMDFLKDDDLTHDQMIDTFVNTAVQVFGSVEEAKKKIYALSTTEYQGFQVECSEETAEKFKSLPGVVFVLPDSYIDPVNKEYGGDKYVNGEIFPRPAPVHFGKHPREQNNGPPPQQNNGPPPQQNNSPPPQQNYVPRPKQKYAPLSLQSYGPRPQKSYGPRPQKDNGPSLQLSSGPPPQKYEQPPQQNYSPPQKYEQPPQQNYSPPQKYEQPQQQNYSPPQKYEQPRQQNYSPPQQGYASYPLPSYEPLPQSFGQKTPESYGYSPNYPPQQNYSPAASGKENPMYSYQRNFNQPEPRNYGAPQPLRQNYCPPQLDNAPWPNQSYGQPSPQSFGQRTPESYGYSPKYPPQQNYSPAASGKENPMSSYRGYFNRPDPRNYEASPPQSYEQPLRQNYSLPQQDYAPLPNQSYGQPSLQNFWQKTPESYGNSPNYPPQQNYSPASLGKENPVSSYQGNFNRPDPRNYGAPPAQSYEQPLLQNYSPPQLVYAPWPNESYGQPSPQSFGQKTPESYGNSPNYPPPQNYSPASLGKENPVSSYQGNFNRPDPRNYGAPPAQSYEQPLVQNYSPPQLVYAPWPNESYGQPSPQSFGQKTPESYGNSPNYPPQQNYSPASLGKENPVSSYQGNFNRPDPRNYGAPPAQSYEQPLVQNYSPPQLVYAPWPTESYGQPSPQSFGQKTPESYGNSPNYPPPQNYSPASSGKENPVSSYQGNFYRPEPRNYGAPPPQSYEQPLVQNYSPPQQDYAPLPNQSYGQPSPQSFGQRTPESYGNSPNYPPEQNYSPVSLGKENPVSSYQGSFNKTEPGNYGAPPPHSYDQPLRPNYSPQQLDYVPWPNQSYGLLSPQSFWQNTQQGYGNSPNFPPQQNYIPAGSGNGYPMYSYQQNLSQPEPRNHYAQGQGNLQSHVPPDQGGFLQDADFERISRARRSIPSVRNN